MLGLSLAIVIAVGIFSYRSGQAAKTSEQERTAAQQIAIVNRELLSSLKDAETGQRGYLLTGEERYLAPYNDALAAIPPLLTRFQNATAARPEQAARISRINTLAAQKLAELKTTIDLRREKKQAEALAIVITDRGKDYMDQIRAVGAEIEQDAVSRAAAQQLQAERSALNLRVVSTGGAILLAAFLAAATITIFRGMARREELFKQAYSGEKLLGATLTSIADGVIATDARGRVTMVNPVAQKLTGWSEADSLGLPVETLFVIVNETTRSPVDNPIRQALSQGSAVGLANHTNLVSRSGEERPIDDSAAPVKDEHGAIVGAVLVFRDISARRRTERELRSANGELQQFVDAAAHDLRSPLNSVNSMAQMLAKDYESALGPRGTQLLGFISAGTDRMRRLLDDLLAFARASHFDGNTAPSLSLEVPFRMALTDLSAEIDRTGAEVTSEPLPALQMHEAHALQLFQNLIGNAIKYHNQGRPKIHVRAETDPSECVISVADNGIGIEPQYIEQIFAPFKRLHSDQYPGSGIGLATCRKIVKGYGGRIWAESSPGRGSTFYFALPTAEAGASAQSPASH